jgi:methylenetetrahydrofolate reductase (NADPH)
MRILDLFTPGQPAISFEFFPPKTDGGFRSLFRTIEDLKRLDPAYVSVTMGAGGSTRAKTVDLVTQIQREIGITAMAHLPCVGFERSEIATLLDRLEEAGIENVLALGGDPPRDAVDFVRPADGFTHANELAAFIRARGRHFCIGGACYPEVHPAAPSAEVDLDNLKRKVDDGADFLITQLFFDNRKFFDFVERARARGIEAPIVPGIMPINTVAGVRRMTSLGGGELPPELDEELSRVAEDEAATRELGVRWATSQCRELVEASVPGIHFYTLNKCSSTRQIYENLFRS